MLKIGQAIRQFLGKLPPEAQEALMGDYLSPVASWKQTVEAAISKVELQIENAASGANLDQEWLKGQGARRLDEANASHGDNWNEPPAP
jgi:hypothetical protein